LNENFFFEGGDFDTELLVKMSGAILRKAEMENNFEGVYTKVFEHIVKMEVIGFVDVVEVLGETGG
jgi:hypothetical protein